MADLALRKSTMTGKGIKDAVTEIWTPPTFSAGKVPQVISGRSNNQDIEGDFPLDQVVINRKLQGTDETQAAHLFNKSFLQVPKSFPLTGMERLRGPSLQESPPPMPTANPDSISSSVPKKIWYKTAPKFVPKPYTWGKLNVSKPDTYFFLCDFIDSWGPLGRQHRDRV
ncbi:MAG: hypothetical protein Q9176_005253 [Flavoplaca citrina]